MATKKYFNNCAKMFISTANMDTISTLNLTGLCSAILESPGYSPYTGKIFERNVRKVWGTIIALVFKHRSSSAFRETEAPTVREGLFFLLENHATNKELCDRIIEKSTDPSIAKDKPPSASTSRAFLEGCLFLLDVVIHTDYEKYRYFYDNMNLLSIRARRDQLDLLISKDASNRVTLVPKQEEILAAIPKTYAYATRESIILRLYAHFPLRDDLQVRVYYPEDADAAYPTDQGNILIIHESYSADTPPVNPFVLWVCTSKTIGKGYDSIGYTLPKEISDEIWLYIFHVLGGWTTGLNSKYVFGNQKFSQQLIRWTSAIGLELVNEYATGSIETSGAGVNFFRKAHHAWAEGDLAREAEVIRQSAHTKDTALVKYRAKRKRGGEMELETF